MITRRIIDAGMPSEIDIYPVGLFSDWKRGQVWYGLKNYVWGYGVKQKHWRSVRSHFNGYLAECTHGGHNAGRGWTTKSALRRVRRIHKNAGF